MSAFLSLSPSLYLVFQLVWHAVSAFLGLSPPFSPSLSPIFFPCCLSRLVWDAVSASLRLSSRPALVSGLVSHLAVSASLLLSPILSPMLSFRPALGCCVRLLGLVSALFSQLVSSSLHVVSPTLSGMLCPPSSRPALVSGLVSQLVSHLAVSASLGLSPILSPMLSFRPHLGCCVRLLGLVSALFSQLVSHLLSMLSLPPVWEAVSASLGLSSRPAHLAVSASLGLSPILSPMLSFRPGLGCCVRLPFLPACLPSSLHVVSPTLSGMLCPPLWACLRGQLLSPPFSPSLSPSWSGTLGLSPSLCPVLSPSFHPQSENKKQKSKLHVRFLQLFGVYRGVLFWIVDLGRYGMIVRLQDIATSMCLLKVELKCLTRCLSIYF